MSSLAPSLPEPWYVPDTLSDDDLERLMGDEQIIQHFQVAFSKSPRATASKMFLLEKGLIRSRALDSNEEKANEEEAKKRRKKGSNPYLKLVEKTPPGQGLLKGQRHKAVANLRPYSAIKTEKCRWLYPGRIPHGALTLVTGDPGGGKSTWLGDVATRISRGWTWPEGGVADLGSVLIVQQEESKGSDIKPRLERMGADMERIIDLVNFNRGEKVHPSLKITDDIDVIESCCDQITDLRLVIIDPIASVFRGQGIYNDAEVRDALMPLTSLAEKRGFSIAAVIQFNKDSDRPLKYRMSNSAAFVQVARMCWYISDDPRSPNKKVLSLAKHNPTDAVKTGLSWTLSEGRLLFDRKPVPFTGEQIDAALQKQRLRAADAVLQVSEEKEWKKVARFLLDLLAKGEIAQQDALDLSEDHGYKESTFGKAVKQLLSERNGPAQIERFRKDVKGGQRFFLRLPLQVELPSLDTASPASPGTALKVIDPHAQGDFHDWLRGLVRRPWDATLWRRALTAF